MTRKTFIVGLVLIPVLMLVSSGAISQQTIESGTFFFQIEGDVGIEGFQFVQLEDGNLKLTSEFEALSEELVLDFGTDKLFTQEIVLTPELDLVSYLLDSDTQRGKFHVEVTVEDGVATMRFEAVDATGKTERGERQVILEESVVTTGIAASQFFLMQRFVNQKLELAPGEEVTVLAFNPTDVDEPFVELTFRELPPVTIEDTKTKEQFRARRVEVRQEEFRAELLSCAETADEGEGPCTEPGRFLGFLSSTATLAGVRLNDAPGGGALVVDVAPGSFAAQAGLQKGDVITHVDGTRIEDARDLRNVIRFRDPTEPATLTVERGNETLEIEVRLSGSRLLVFRVDLFEGGFAILGEAEGSS
jgi:hypothetical protein